MNIMKYLPKTLTRTVSRGVLTIKKYSPEILTVTAVACGIGATATAIERTTKLDDVLAEIEHDQEKLQQMREYKDQGVVTEEQYSEQELLTARVVYGCKAALKVANHYRVPIALSIACVASQIGSYTILKNRYMGVVAAATALQGAFESYRAHVADEVGEEKEKEFFARSSAKLEEGLKKAEEKKPESQRSGSQTKKHQPSMYARWFDEASRYWKKSPGANAMFIRSQERYWNDILRIRGHVFLNEVYDSLDIPRTAAGAVVGWVFDTNNDDPQIDFGLIDGSIERYRDFLNGRELNVLLDFNVDGVIYDLI